MVGSLAGDEVRRHLPCCFSAVRLWYFVSASARAGRAFSTVHVPCPVALIRFSMAVVTSTRRKDEGRRDDGESKPAEGRPTEARQGFAKATHPCGSGKRRSFRS